MSTRSKWQPMLSTLWDGWWPYDEHEGVGLRFDGTPTNAYAFQQFLGMQGCHQDASQRIIDRISVAGFDMLTVSAQRDFPMIAERLAQLGVIMTIIPPQPNWEKRFVNVGQFRDDFLPPHLRKKPTLNDPVTTS